jgi:hypothetical protein
MADSHTQTRRLANSLQVISVHSCMARRVQRCAAVLFMKTVMSTTDFRQLFVVFGYFNAGKLRTRRFKLPLQIKAVRNNTKSNILV